jgi:hypothetical protein
MSGIIKELMMEKPKRNSQRPFFSLLFVLLIFILGFLMGFIALKVYQNDDEIYGQIPPVENSSACTPNTRDYPEALVLEGESDTFASGSLPNSGGVVSVAATGTTEAIFYATLNPASPVPSTGQNAPVPTSVALMSASPIAGAPVGNNANTVMTNPGTYTPEPSGTPVARGTQAPQPTANQQAAQTEEPFGALQEVVVESTQIPSTTSVQTQLTNPLSAGEIDDNAEWDVYLSYRENFAQSGSLYSPISDVDIRNRQLIQVVNTQGEGILGAMVEVLTEDGSVLQTSCTYADGFTMFLPNAYDAAQQENRFQVRVSKNGVVQERELQLSSDVLTVQLDTRQALTKLDLLFLIDATGSMDDEIAAITNNIQYISQEIDALPDAIDVRYGLVSFKDPYYSTEVWDFTSDVNLFQSQLATLYTAGGDGETLNDGLDRSVHQVHWRGGDTVKLVFMIGDEPPGVYPEHPSYSVSMLDALYAGIKVHPIASSGLDLQGEYIFRQVAQVTMGHFIFLSYDNGASTAVTTGEGQAAEGSVADEPFGQYNVAVLHEIVLNLVREELGFAMEE